MTENTEKQLRSIYILGGTATILALSGILLDVIIGNITGGNLSALPQTAVDRFAQFQNSPLKGLYNLDLLNIIIQIILIPAYIALFAVHCNINKAYASLALIGFLVGTFIMVTNNSALPMLELSKKYFASSSESQKILFAAAGEGMLARGAHGSAGAFLGFLIPNIAGLIMSIVMLKGKIFSKINSWLGITGSALILVYIIMVTFVPGVENMATAFAMPGGILLMAWMVMFTIKFFRMGHSETSKLDGNS